MIKEINEYDRVVPTAAFFSLYQSYIFSEADQK